jgi:hypothetical protein
VFNTPLYAILENICKAFSDLHGEFTKIIAFLSFFFFSYKTGPVEKVPEEHPKERN